MSRDHCLPSAESTSSPPSCHKENVQQIPCSSTSTQYHVSLDDTLRPSSFICYSIPEIWKLFERQLDHPQSIRQNCKSSTCAHSTSREARHEPWLSTEDTHHNLSQLQWMQDLQLFHHYHTVTWKTLACHESVQRVWRTVVSELACVSVGASSYVLPSVLNSFRIS